MSWKTKYLEAENARLLADNRLLLSALLERAGHPTVAAMMREQQPTKVATVASPDGLKLPPNPERPIARGWRGLQAWWQSETKPAEIKEQSNG